MKNIITNVINRGGYDLDDILSKIDTYYIEGRLTADERNELYERARSNPAPHFDYGAEIERLWKKIRELEAKLTPSDSDTNDAPTVEPWKQPTGAHDAYVYGQRMLFTDGKVYESIYEGLNVWSPLVHPAGWKVVV